MEKATSALPLPSVATLLKDLGTELDGIADLGMTMCFSRVPEARRGFVAKRCRRVREIVSDLYSWVEHQDSSDVHALAVDLLLASSALLDAFATLADFRSLRSAVLLATINSLLPAWDRTHRTIRLFGELLGLSEEPWHVDILNRHGQYRTGLENAIAAMRTEPSESSTTHETPP